MQCKTCGQDNPPEANFCGNCGASLTTGVELPSPTVEPSPAQVPRKWLLIGGLAILMITGVVISLALLSNETATPPSETTTPPSRTTTPPQNDYTSANNHANRSGGNCFCFKP